MDILCSRYNLRGLELIKDRAVKFCSDHQCYNLAPLCCLTITPECSETITKWYHLTNGEHICNACCNRILSFFSYESSCNEISEWKRCWITSNAYENAAVNDFITNRMLPYWCKCITCNKWRQLTMFNNSHPPDFNNFTCCTVLKFNKLPCLVNEERKVELVRHQPELLIQSMDYDALLESNPLIDGMIANAYSLDTIGICPTAVKYNTINAKQIYRNSEFMRRFHPFMKQSNGNNQNVLGSVDATTMDMWEMKTFNVFKGKQRSLFLGLRNLILLLWAADPKRPVDMELMNIHCIIRGIIRVSLIDCYLPQMLRVYTTLGYINFGLIHPMKSLFDMPKKKHYVVIGASMSGLSAALHLQASGADVTVVDGSSKLHRMNDKDDEAGLFGCDKLYNTLSNFNELEGDINNPLSYLAHQSGIQLHPSTNDLVIFSDKSEQPIKHEDDEYYQNLVYSFVTYLDEQSSVIELFDSRADDETSHGMKSIYDVYEKYKNQYSSTSSSLLIDQSNTKCNIESIYLSELEYRLFGGRNMCDIHYTHMSWLHDHSWTDISDYCYSSHMSNHFEGDSVTATYDDWCKIITKMMTHIGGVQYSKQVKRITVDENDNNEKKVNIEMNDKSTIQCDGVVIATRPSIANQLLSNNNIKYQTNHVIIVNLVIPCSDPYWIQLIKLINIDPTTHLLRSTFSIVPQFEQRGFCPIFRHVSNIQYQQHSSITLQSIIFSTAANDYIQLADCDIISVVVDKLYRLCNNTGDDFKSRPQLDQYNVTRMTTEVEGPLQMESDNKIKVDPSLDNSIIAVTDKKRFGEPISLTSSFIKGQEAAIKLIRNIIK